MGMGRLSAIGIGYPLAEQPAHSAFLSSTQADFSGYGRRSVLRSSQQYSQVGTGGLQNLGLSFARGKGWGFALGLAPQALQGYYGQLRTSTPIPLQFSEKAEGILSRAQLSLAFRRRSLAAGYQLGYLWGSYDRQRDLGTPAQTFPDYLITQTRLAGLQHRIGLLWQDTIRNSAVYQLSLSYTASAPLQRELLYTFQKNFSLTNIAVDTLAYFTDRWQYGGGWRGGVWGGFPRFSVGVEGGLFLPSQSWSGPGLPPAQARTAWDIRAGIEAVWDPRSPRFYRRIRYQLGGLIAQPPFAENRLLALTAGLGWQMPRTPNLVYFTLEQGWLPHPTVSERYLQVGIGVIFRESWFIPPRID